MAFDAHGNLAYGQVVAVPSPAISGTSLTLVAGQGAQFPSPPFNATVWPPGALALSYNAEIVRVTVISGDTFTFTRAQEGTSAIAIGPRFQFAESITAKTLTDIEAAVTSGVAGAQPTSQKDQASGYAGLDGGGLLKVAELPSSVVNATDATIGQTLVVASGPAPAFVNSVVDAQAFFPTNWTQNVTDVTAGILSAIAAANVPISGFSGNNLPNRVVQLPAGRLRVSSVITLPPNITLRGHGPANTYLFSSQTTGNVITNASGAVQCQVEDLGIVQSAPTAGAAISWSGQGASILGDGRFVVRNVVIVGPYIGITSAGTTECRVEKVTVQRPVVGGFNFYSGATDAFFSDCTVGQPGQYGFVTGANTRVWGCKVFGGGDGTTASIGFDASGGGRCEIGVCEVQDLNGIGFRVDNPAVMVGCIADSVALSGFSISSNTWAAVSACYALVRGGGVYTTALGFDFQYANYGRYDVITTGCTRAVEFGGGGDYSAAQGQASFKINGSDAQQAVNYATTVTPDPYAGGTVVIGTRSSPSWVPLITGNLLIANPSTAAGGTTATNWYPDQRMTFVLPVDGTGGYTLAFGTAYVLAATAPLLVANTVVRMSFAWDFDNQVWREISRQPAGRVAKRVLITNAPGATPTLDTDNYDVAVHTGLATPITSMSTNLTGTPANDGDVIIFKFTDNGTAQAITWGAKFEASTVALPTTTSISTLLTVGFQWNTVTSKWRCVGAV